MSEPIETVKIVREDVPGGYAVINKEDLKPEDVIYEALQGRTKRKTASQDARG